MEGFFLIFCDLISRNISVGSGIFEERKGAPDDEEAVLWITDFENG